MTGVEILTSAEVVSEAAFNLTTFWTTFGIAFGIFVIVGIGEWIFDNCEWAVIPAFAVLGLFAGGLFGAMSGAIFEIPTAYETQYKVTISDEVSMTDFYEHYEVIDQEGKIFTVRERTEDAS